jgi:hypothetical protein
MYESKNFYVQVQNSMYNYKISEECVYYGFHSIRVVVNILNDVYESNFKIL